MLCCDQANNRKLLVSIRINFTAIIEILQIFILVLLVLNQQQETSCGVVYEFDKEGLLTGNNEDWVECLAVPVVAKCDNTWKEFWDYTLQVVSTQEKWDCSRYDEENHNCYTFVLTFLRTLQVKELKPSLQNKMRFCMDFIIPRTRGAAKYIALFRILQKDGVCVQC
ncbi:MKRN2 opposite strand protein-like [Tachypleus tridentatus]|uniref:MKRN2 opposite strand protein-like n=1 Tax=Tachypleus tridentatus TaxID=6853 RepID=UPI003FD4130F